MSEEFDDPYSDSSQDHENESPQLDHVMSEAIRTALLEVNVALPAKIVQIKGSQKVDVQPLLQTRLKNGDTIDRPVIQDVPVMVPSGQDYWIQLPIAVGDTGTIIFSQRSLDKWLVSGGSVNPDDPRIFDLSDAIFFPGLSSFDDQIPADSSTEMVFNNGSAQIVMKKSGKFKITNGNKELIQVLKDLTTTLTNAFTLTAIGPQKLDPATQLALQEALLDINSLLG